MADSVTGIEVGFSNAGPIAGGWKKKKRRLGGLQEGREETGFAGHFALVIPDKSSWCCCVEPIHGSIIVDLNRTSL